METNGVYRVRHKESSFDESEHGFQEQKVKNIQSSFTHSSSYDMIFWIIVIFSQLVGIACVALVAYWLVHEFGGFAWTSSASLQFNYHPLLMVLGLIFCYGEAILTYRVLHFLPKWILKWIHAVFHLSALVMASVGLAAVFENHRRGNLPDMYSLHSWIGIGTFGFFCVQYIFSFITFLVPGLPVSIRTKVMPFHTFFGLGIFCLAVASALMGITEKLSFSNDYWFFKKKAVIGNSLGVCIVVFALSVGYLVAHTQYKRKPLPSDTQIGPSPTN